MVNRALPTEVKRKRGTLRQDRVPGELVPVGKAALTAPPPSSLQATGIDEWERTLRTCPWIAESDLGALRIQCELLDRRASIIEEIFGSEANAGPAPLLMETSTGYAYSNPLLISLLKVEDQLAKWTSLLGKTPSDRSRLGVAEVKAQSKLEDLASRRAARSGSARSATSRSRSQGPDEPTLTAEDTGS